MPDTVTQALDRLETQMRRYAERHGIEWPPRDTESQQPASLLAGIDEDEL